MIKVMGWRISREEPSGLSCWFDPAHEMVMLRALTREEKAVRLDHDVSVSAAETEAELAPSKYQRELLLPPHCKALSDGD